MLDKIKNMLPALMSKARTALANLPAPIKWVACLYGGFVFALWVACVVLFAHAYLTGGAEWDELLKITQDVTSPATISFVTFVIGLCIDSNGDGVPDNMDKDGE